VRSNRARGAACENVRSAPSLIGLLPLKDLSVATFDLLFHG
jgi:hypothetical protein